MAVKVAVTGASGYIGRHVVSALLRRGCEVTACDLRPADFPEGVRFSDADIFSGAADIYDQLGRPDAVIHLAWMDGFVHNSPKHMAQLSAHVRFLNALVDAGLPKLSVMGSMHEVGYWEGAITADTPCKPLSQYGVAKNALRQSMLLYAAGKATSLRWLRAYYIFGDDARASSIFAKLTQAAERGQETFPFTSGKNKYDFISVEDLAEQIAAAALQDKHEGIINCCTGEPKSLAEQVEWFIRDRGLNIRLAYNTFPDRPYDSPGVWGDAAVIREIMEGE
ncbi:MAG: NAD-dependent epimerase/dehydratase family protein [Clostridia bacterium]|nr:NAD-dependent epimerase/dehydratase family protein [Clostridia bacterium]